jgi:hypothetical protein
MDDPGTCVGLETGGEDGGEVNWADVCSGGEVKTKSEPSVQARAVALLELESESVFHVVRKDTSAAEHVKSTIFE